MKKNKYLYLLAVLLSATAFSCKKLTDIQPVTNNSTENFYKTPADFNAAALAVYNGLLPLSVQSNWALSDVRSDDTYKTQDVAQRDGQEVGLYTVSSATGELQTLWDELYTIVYRANVLQEKIAPFADFAQKQQYIAEARMLRAYAYFELVRYWGPVPLVTHTLSPEEAKVNPRAPREGVYALIISDLQFAEANLPASYAIADKGRATKWAAKALLGKVYLTMAGYPLKQTDKLPLAQQKLGEVIDNEGNGYGFSPVYADLFKSVNDNKFNVWEIQYISGGFGLGNPLPGEQPIALPTDWTPFQPTGFGYSPSRNLINSWAPADVRRPATIDTMWLVNGKPYFKDVFTKFVEKTVKTAQNRSDWPGNFPLIRYEDVLLMYAEIENEQVGNGSPPPVDAITKLNRIHVRAGLPPVYPATKEDFKLAMENERRWEFAGEGLRWHDLVRTGRAIPVMNAYHPISGEKVTRPITENDLIYPIPFKEININPGFLQQNPGYN